MTKPLEEELEDDEIVQESGPEAPETASVKEAGGSQEKVQSFDPDGWRNKFGAYAKADKSPEAQEYASRQQALWKKIGEVKPLSKEYISLRDEMQRNHLEAAKVQQQQREEQDIVKEKRLRRQLVGFAQEEQQNDALAGLENRLLEELRQKIDLEKRKKPSFVDRAMGRLNKLLDGGDADASYRDKASVNGVRISVDWDDREGLVFDDKGGYRAGAYLIGFEKGGGEKDKIVIGSNRDKAETVFKYARGLAEIRKPDLAGIVQESQDFYERLKKVGE